MDPINYPPRIQKLVNLLRNRTIDGRRMNMREWRAYHAIDIAHEISYTQTTPTFVNHVLSKNLTEEETREELAKFGLKPEELFLKVQDPKTGKQVGWKFNYPIFFKIVIPLVKAYVTVRLAKIFNERNTVPFLPFNPLKETTRDELLCEIWTDLINTISTQYGYPAVLRQAIQQMLKYGVSLVFPREEWHCERQMTDEGKITVKEGIRYIHPHPTQMFYDLMYPLTSINTDSGTEYAGHWTVMRYGDILDNPKYWNRRLIFAGTNWFKCPEGTGFWDEVFPCQINFFPYGYGDQHTRDERNNWYNPTTDRDKSIFITEHFAKIIPDDYGLADTKQKGKGYKYPVWHRFTLAGDDTVIWAEPCAYNPVWFMGYDYDENAALNPSLALDLIPYQDHLGMILSQMILTARSNLRNLTFYNEQAVKKEEMERLVNSGNTQYTDTNYVGYNPMGFSRAGIDPGNVFHTVQFGRSSIQEHLQLVPLVLNILERVLQISSQEVGSAASHQQGKVEIEQTAGASTNRLAFTSSYVDEGVDAWKRQLVAGCLAYKDVTFLAQVSTDVPDLEKHLEDLGFKLIHKGDEKSMISGSKNKLRLEYFASSLIGVDEARAKEIAQVIFQTVGTIAGQPDLHKKVGSKNLIKLIEMGARLASGEKEFKIEMDTNAEHDDDVPANIMQAIQTAQQATMKAIEEKIAAPAAQEMHGIEQQVQQMQQLLQQLKGIYQVAAKQQDKNTIAAKEAAAEIQRKDALAAAELRRQEEKHQLEMKQEQEKAQLEGALAAHKAVTAPKKSS